MLAPREFPEWLPAAVRDEAQRILGSEGADEALVLRLATDERMEAVWRELEKHKTDKPCQLSDRWATLMRDRVDVPPPDSSDPLVLFFWYAYTIAWLGPITGNTSEWDNPIAQYRAEAALLRYSAARLCELNAQYGSLTSMRDESGNVQDRFTKEYASQIEDAAKFADWIAGIYTNLKAAEAPLAIERNFGSREERGYVRMLAAETRSLFGQLLAGTLAKVASVALMKEITAGQVHNWARSVTVTE